MAHFYALGAVMSGNITLADNLDNYNGAMVYELRELISNILATGLIACDDIQKSPWKTLSKFPDGTNGTIFESTFPSEPSHMYHEVSKPHFPSSYGRSRTKNNDLDMLTHGGSLGAEPLRSDLKLAKLRFGPLQNSGLIMEGRQSGIGKEVPHAAFGFEKSVGRLQKGSLYV